MEIKSVKKENVKYKKASEMKFYKMFPKLTSTSFVVELLMHNKSFAGAYQAPIIGTETLSGYMPVHQYQPVRNILGLTQWLSLFIALGCIIAVVVEKILTKIKGETYKVTKKMKITFAVFFIWFILSGIILTKLQ